MAWEPLSYCIGQLPERRRDYALQRWAGRFLPRSWIYPFVHVSEAKVELGVWQPIYFLIGQHKTRPTGRILSFWGIQRSQNERTGFELRNKTIASLLWLVVPLLKSDAAECNSPHPPSDQTAVIGLPLVALKIIHVCCMKTKSVSNPRMAGAG